ncbi:hypothetical protein [Actinomyces naeslundii]|uniref:hypothetical protein n=1 Tax=Actinomyces naeslundii TaxID=1655 RepID=UPI0011778958|nr:hypothetical protein [Actinomyces naeslundii]
MNTKIDIIDVSRTVVKVTDSEVREAIIYACILAAAFIVAVIAAVFSKRLRPTMTLVAFGLAVTGPLPFVSLYADEHTTIRDENTALQERYGSATEVACPDNLNTSFWTNLRGAGNTCYQIGGNEGPVVAVKQQDTENGYRLTVDHR